jgi:(R,R)-butanediol dehydrogenase/meso-butanediol dehydrogenase/diacetyl reductase
MSPTRATRELIGEEGVDMVFDTTSVSAAFNAGIRALRPRGSMVSVAGWSQPAAVDMGVAMGKEADIRFNMTYEPDVDFPAALTLLANRAADPDLLISDHIPLADVVGLGLEELLHNNDAHVKILVDPTPP